jgi:hypothetical protein
MLVLLPVSVVSSLGQRVPDFWWCLANISVGWRLGDISEKPWPEGSI